MRRLTNIKQGFTLAELVVTMTIALMLIASVGFFIVDSQKSWARSYQRVYEGVTADSLVARKTIDTVCRKATMKRVVIGVDGEFIELYYYQDPKSLEIDRYARFYTYGDELRVDYGALEPGSFNLSTISKTTTLARHVKAVNFSVDRAAVQMVLDLDDGQDRVQVTLSSLRHNK